MLGFDIVCTLARDDFTLIQKSSTVFIVEPKLC